MANGKPSSKNVREKKKAASRIERMKRETETRRVKGGLYRAAPPVSLFSELSTVKPEPERIDNRNVLQASQSAPKLTSKKKMLEKEEKKNLCSLQCPQGM